jgi:hypothetical protein
MAGLRKTGNGAKAANIANIAKIANFDCLSRGVHPKGLNLLNLLNILNLRSVSIRKIRGRPFYGKRETGNGYSETDFSKNISASPGKPSGLSG